jgi:hypothetical protein
MMKNLLFTKLNVSFLMGNALDAQSGSIRKYGCFLGIELVVIG